MIPQRERSQWHRFAHGPTMLRAGLAACAALAPTMAWPANSCAVAASPLAFGAYNTMRPLAGTSALTITCRHDGQAYTFNYTLALSSGSGMSGKRQLSGPRGALAVNYYTTSARTTVWGDGSGATATVSGSLFVPRRGGNSGTRTEIVHGLVGAPQRVAAGAYVTSSPVIVTLSGNFSSTTTTLDATATVPPECTVSAGNLDFGTVTPANSQRDAASTLAVACTADTPYTVGLDAGTTAGATIVQRLMAHGSDTLRYNLYTDFARSSIWGDSSGSWVAGTGTGLGNPQPLTVYGRVADGQASLVPGAYRENAVNVTVTY